MGNREGVEMWFNCIVAIGAMLEASCVLGAAGTQRPVLWR